MTGSFALAEEDSDTISACVVESSGSVRLLLDGSTDCRNGEVLKQWGVGAGGDTDDPLAPLKIADQMENDGLVHWTQLFDVPDAVTGDHGFGAFRDSLVTAPSQPDSNDTGLVHWQNLFGIPEAWLDGFVSGGEIADDSISSDHLAGSDDPNAFVPGAVTSDKILNGTIQGRDIRAGQVTSEHLSLRHSSAADTLSYVLLTTGVNAPLHGPTVSGVGTYLLSGQAQLALEATEPNMHALIQYQLVRVTGGVAEPVSPTYETGLTPGQPKQVASVAVVNSPHTAGDHTYFLRFHKADGQADFAVSNTVLSATELG